MEREVRSGWVWGKEGFLLQIPFVASPEKQPLNVLSVKLSVLVFVFRVDKADFLSKTGETDEKRQPLPWLCKSLKHSYREPWHIRHLQIVFFFVFAFQPILYYLLFCAQAKETTVQLDCVVDAPWTHLMPSKKKIQVCFCFSPNVATVLPVHVGLFAMIIWRRCLHVLQRQNAKRCVKRLRADMLVSSVMWRQFALAVYSD